MLFSVSDDPHEQYDLAPQKPEVVSQAMALLAEWYHCMIQTSSTNIDPMMTVLREGGPFYTRGQLPKYLKRLRETGRAHHAETLAAQHPDEL